MTTESDLYFISNPKSRLLYIVCGIFCVGVIVALPYTKIDVTVRTAAFIRAASQINIIRSLESGRVKNTYLRENKKVKTGDILLILESDRLTEQSQYMHEKIAAKEASMRDTKKMIGMEKQRGVTGHTMTMVVLPEFSTDYYRQSYLTYHQKLAEAVTSRKKAQQDFDRNDKLYRQQVIPASEFENYQFELQKSEDAILQIKQDQLGQWENQQKNLFEEKLELGLQLSGIEKEKVALTIKAPLNGTIQNLAGIYPGSMVYANQELGQISPDTRHIVIAYVHPNDIGLIHQGMNARLQVDAFNYNQWGMASGQVLEVPQDIKIIDNQPVFEVRCSLDKDFLQLKNGYKGYLKKGMTLQARFIVTERSLWQLLFDKVDNWLNPNL